MELEVTNNKGVLLHRMEVLRHLQTIDKKLIELTKRKESLLGSLEKEHSELQQKRASFEEKQKESMNFQKDIDSKTLDLTCMEEEIKKLRAKLFQIKNNKEYTALLSEIGSKEADKSVLEDEILSMMSGLEEFQKEGKELNQKVQEEEKALAEHKRKTEAEIESIEKEAQEGQKRWQENAAMLDQEALLQYRRLIERYGLAVVEVEGETCGGCNMSLTPQTVNLLLRRQELIFCKMCGKILYLPES